MEELVERYIRLRDAKDQLKKMFAKRIGPIDEALETIEGLLLKQFDELGVESARCASGTAYKSRRTSATVADWEATLNHVIKHQNWSMLEKRVSKDAVGAYREEYGELPPGVNWREEVTVNIRRS